MSGNTITFSHSALTGSYTPEYTTYTINSSVDHNWYNDTDNGTSTPSTINAGDLNPTYTWSLTSNGGGAASIDPSTGVLTLNSTPTDNIVVRLTVSNISPLANKTVDFTLTRTHYNEVVSTTATISSLTVSPTTATLEYNESQAFTATASVTATTTTTPAYERLANGGTTYYFYDNALHTSAPASSSEETHPEPTYSWTLSGTAATYLSLSTTSGSSTSVTHSTGAQSNSNATLTVTASTAGASNRTATATVTVAPTTATAIDAEGLTLYVGNGGTVSYTLTPDYAYHQVRATSANTGIFTVDASPVNGGSVSITSVAPGRANLNLVALKPDGTDGPTKAVAITVRNVVAEPEISFGMDGSAIKATITCATGGATIKYTTDGSDPATSGTAQTYSAPVTVNDGTTVKAYALGSNDYWDASTTATKVCTPIEYAEQGVSGGIVTLNDLEDHNWTYYSGVDASVDGGNYNTNYVGKLYSPNPRNVKITYNGVNGVSGSTTTVKVSVNSGETQNQFVYYKTLEEGTTSGEYPYQVISNPFSVRPSTGSGNSKVYYGFAGWKIVSGGEYIKNHNNNDVLALDEEIVFNNLPYTSVNCTSAEIVFQTSWTQANVQSGNNITTMLGNFTGGTYETNFAVLTGNYTTAWTGNKNATITSVYPDGSSDSRGVYTRLNVTVNAGYTIKYEYININNSTTTLSMGSGTKTLYIGRGVSNTTANGVVCNLIQGCDGSINSGGLTYTLKIESGVYNYLSFTRGYDGGAQTSTITGTVSMKSVLGCDYDRANGDNGKLKIQQQIMLGYTGSGTQVLRSPAAGDEVLNVTFKSGSLHSSRTDAGTADAAQSFYIGIGGEYSPGYRVFTMEGGEMWSLAAGICKNTATTNSIRFRIKGGLIKGSIYGSAANANSYGYKTMVLTGGQVKGWIAGGGNGTSANGGTTTGSSYLYVGGNCRVDSEGSDTKINSSVGGQVFGSGSGVENTTTWGEMLYGSNVVIADNAYVERNVFGGGNFGWTDEYANIYLTGKDMTVGNVFGGANQNKGDNVRIYMTGGTVREGLYGGSNTTGTINYNVEMHINGGQVGTSSSPANIHGGGYGQPTRVSQNVDITLGKAGQTEPGVIVYGDVYGGSALGYVNGTTATTTYHTNVTMNKGTINGSLYGGGLGAAGTAANVYGPVAVKVYGGSVNKTDANGANGSGGVYGANNVNGAPQRSVTVDIYGTDPAPAADTYALFSVYGGGNAADYTYGNGYPTVKVHNCNNSIEYVYGGGNAAAVAATDVTIYGGNKIGNVFGGGNGTVTAANVTGNAVTKIYGGTIGKVFGGSNSRGTIGGTISVTVDKQGDTDPAGQSTACDMKIGELYGGGNMAASNVGSLSIGCTGNLTAAHATCNETDNRIGYELEGIGDVYGGANAAAVTGDVNLTIDSGMVYRVFGNNNTSASVSGTITVNIDKQSDACGWYVGHVYGGGNKAPYTAPNATPNYPAVNVKNGMVSHNVFGGGLGTTATVTGNPQVTLSGTAEVGGNVYGGGNAAPVSGNTKVTLRD